jgi:hypothetical protein
LGVATTLLALSHAASGRAHRADIRGSEKMRALLLVILGLVVIVAIVVLYGDLHWKSATRELRARLEAARLPIAPKTFDKSELESLPAPVQRYLRAVLEDGQPMVAAVHIELTGTMDMGKKAEQWKGFTSTQRVITRRPGFDWDARIAMMPGLPVRVHDAYVAGEGILHAALLGLVPVADLRGPGEVAQGELIRFFAEAAWYPTALLPSQGVHWEAVDEHSARATLKDGAITLALLFRFDEDGLITTVRAEARGRTVGGTVVPTPWQGRYWNYAIREGMRVPLEGEAAYLLPEGAKPYWRGRVIKLNYELAR